MQRQHSPGANYRYRTVMIVSALLASYPVSYAVWSRVSESRCKKYGLYKAFWYLPEATAEQDDLEVLIGHFYYPLNYVDSEFLNGPAHSAPPLRGFD
jgi:hypothetical protein